jgi:DNA-binding transcriptional LysR family regulator
MDYRYLKAFLLTAEHSSFSKAAGVLGIAQSAVSRQIKLLEEALGTELIIRSSKKIILTEKGRELFLAAQRFDKTTLEIFERRDQRPIQIGILHGLLRHWLIPKLPRLLKKQGRSLTINVGDKAALQKGLEEGRFDVIFSIDDVQTDLVSSLKLFNEKLVLIAKEEIVRKRLHEYCWIVYGEEDNLFKLSKKPSSTVITVPDIHAIVDLVRMGTGIAIVPEHALKKGDSFYTTELQGLERSHVYMTTLNFQNMPSTLRDISEIVQK